ncbi:small acid-soluble spore protein L (minor) [Scopulibacillus darangshiensis]|uniref:Small, acid-soluble spore protein L n=1 Tax=Scopulibacillus darangshiensis TaxID=442528 RepID=A0A4V2SMC2_9BACL|nr:small, acid-soluble spore protein L [Scopulibacillus darangshiensis]TCP26616.1 small acid-soluble spore protein L (minor) [Scopulibacillus darangshiensis]
MTHEKEFRAPRGKTASSVNPQGHSEDVADQRPKSQLEDRAKKKNTKV